MSESVNEGNLLYAKQYGAHILAADCGTNCGRCGRSCKSGVDDIAVESK